jgi:hypothetical protein
MDLGLNSPDSLRKDVVKSPRDCGNAYTRNKNGAYLRAFLNWCINEGIIKGMSPVKDTLTGRLHLGFDTQTEIPLESF